MLILNTFLPFFFSDHHSVTVEAKERAESPQSPKFVLKRDERESRRAELGRHFGTMDWRTLFSSPNCCQNMLDILHNVIHTGLNIMPLRRLRVNTSDVPWMTPLLKSLILNRQRAFVNTVRNHLVSSSIGTERERERLYLK